MENHKILLGNLELYECRIIERTGLFTVRVDFNGVHRVVYINNTGRLPGILVEKRKCYCVKTRRGKLEYKLIGVERGEHSSLIDTRLQEEAFITAQKLGYINWLKNHVLVKRNIKISSEIIDFAFKHGNKLTLVELKSAVMELPGNYTGYPDAPTPRGRRQIKTLADYASQGGEAIVVFIAGVPNARGFQLYCCVDEEIGNVVKYAVEKGVLFKALNIYLDPKLRGIILGETDLPVKTQCYTECGNNA